MHDGHVHGSCYDCDRFVPAFPVSRGLDDWGFCLEQQPAPPPPASLAALEEAYRQGDRRTLATNALGVFRSEPDDACDFFREREGLGGRAP